MDSFTYWIYIRPLWEIALLMAAALLVWGIFGCMSKRIWRIWNRCLCVCAAAAIIYVTVLERSTDHEEIVLIPFYSFIEAQSYSEMYRVLFMNIFLFFPFGLTLPFALPEKVSASRRVLMTITAAAGFSALIETLQYCFRLGRCEVDDVIMNTLGAAIGMLAYSIPLWMRKKCRSGSC